MRTGGTTMKTRTMVILTACLAAIVATAGPAAAQAGPGTRAQAGPPGGPPPGGRGGQETDEEMRAALEQVMLVRLKRVLQLTPEQEPRVMPKVESLLAARRDAAARRRPAVSHLRALMMDETAADADIMKAVKDLRGIDQAFREQEQGIKREINQELNPRQQARMYFFEEHFRRAMQRRMSEAMGGRRGPGGPPAAGGPTSPAPADPDDDLPGDESP
jgi:hypothetical protein